MPAFVRQRARVRASAGDSSAAICRREPDLAGIDGWQRFSGPRKSLILTCIIHDRSGTVDSLC